MHSFEQVRLYLIVTPSLCRDMAQTVAAAIEGGVDAVQLREKCSDDAQYVRHARELVSVCAGAVPLLLNDRWDLVESTGADGVHLGQDDASIESVRRALGPDIVLGLSTHDRAEVQAARGRGADYVGLGPMFATGTKRLTRAPGGAALLASVLDATSLPIFPIGGIDIDSLPDLVAVGARRCAVSSAICAAGDPKGAAAILFSELSLFSGLGEK